MPDKTVIVPGTGVVANEEMIIDSWPDMELEPLQNFILIEKHTQATSAGGIVLPEAAKGKAMRSTWKVLAIGPGGIAGDGTRVPAFVCPGDIVVLSVNRGQVYDVPGYEDRRLVEESTLIALVTQDSGNGA